MSEPKAYDYVIAAAKLAARDMKRLKAKPHIVQIRDLGGTVFYAVYRNRNAVRLIGYVNSLDQLTQNWAYITRMP